MYTAAREPTRPPPTMETTGLVAAAEVELILTSLVLETKRNRDPFSILRLKESPQ